MLVCCAGSGGFGGRRRVRHSACALEARESRRRAPGAFSSKSVRLQFIASPTRLRAGVAQVEERRSPRADAERLEGERRVGGWVGGWQDRRAGRGESPSPCRLDTAAPVCAPGWKLLCGRAPLRVPGGRGGVRASACGGCAWASGRVGGGRVAGRVGRGGGRAGAGESAVGVLSGGPGARRRGRRRRVGLRREVRAGEGRGGGGGTAATA